MDDRNAAKSSRSQSEAASRLKRSRDMLLDLTLRNRLLNFPQGSPEFKERDDRIHKYLPVRASVDATWNQLAVEDKSVKIYSEERFTDDPRGAAAALAEGGLISSAEPEHLEKRLQKLHREHETLQASTGDGAFFLATGFLEWQEAPPKQLRPLYAPLLLLQVRLVRKTSPHGGRRGFVLEMVADQHVGNPSLHEKLKSEHNLVLPQTEDDDTPTDYLTRVARAIKGKSGWKIHPTAALGFFNFARYRLWLDLDPLQWPAGQSPHQHAIVSDLLEQKWRGDRTPLPSDEDVAEVQQERDLPIVLDADGTQYAALIAANRGQSEVVIGPPGSGKSQTITNLIAVAIAEGKRVLFVAQKRAALEVVRRLLEKVELAPFCLSLHSDHSKPSDVQSHLSTARHALGTRRARARGGAGAAQRNGFAWELNQVAGALGESPKGHDSTTAEILHNACALRAQVMDGLGSAWNESLLALDVPEGRLPANWLEAREKCLLEWHTLRGEAGEGWVYWTANELTPMDVPQVESALRDLLDAAERARSQLAELPDLAPTTSADSLSVLLSGVLEKALPQPLCPALLRFVWATRSNQSSVHELEQVIRDYERQKSNASRSIKWSEDDAEQTADSVAKAASLLLNRVRPNTSIEAAQAVLKSYGGAIGLVQDLVAHAAAYRDAMPRWLGGDGATEFTFGVLDRLHGFTARPLAEPPTGIAPGLARRVIDRPELSTQLREVLKQIERAQASIAAADALLPGLSTLSESPRQDLATTLGRLATAGFGAVKMTELAHVSSDFRALARHGTTLLSVIDRNPDGFPAAAAGPNQAFVRHLFDRSEPWLGAVAGRPEKVNPVLVGRLAAATVEQSVVTGWCRVCDEARDRLAEAAPFLGPEFGRSDGAVVLDGLRALSRSGAENATAETLEQFSKLCAELTELLPRVIRRFGHFARGLGLPVPTSVSDLATIAGLSERLASLPDSPATALVGGVTTAAEVAAARRVIANCATAAEAQARLRDVCAFEDVPALSEISEIRKVLRASRGSMFRWLSGAYRGARRTIRQFCKDSRVDDATVIRILEDLSIYLQHSQMVDADTAARQLFRDGFVGVATCWTGASEVLAWADDYFKAAGGSSVSLQQLASMRANEDVGKLRQALQIVSAVRNKITLLQRHPCWPIQTDATERVDGPEFDPLLADCQRLRLSMDRAASELRHHAAAPSVTVAELLRAAAVRQSAIEALASVAEAEEAIGAAPEQIDTVGVRSDCAWFEACIAAGMPSTMVAALVKDPITASGWLRELVNITAELRTASQACLAWTNQAEGNQLISESVRVCVDVSTAATSLAVSVSHVTQETSTVADLASTVNDLNNAMAIRDAATEWNAAVDENCWTADQHRFQKTIEWADHARVSRTPVAVLHWILEADTVPRFLWWDQLLGSVSTLKQELRTLQSQGVLTQQEIPDALSIEVWADSAAGQYAGLSQSLDVLRGCAADFGKSLSEVKASAASLSRSVVLAGTLAKWTDRIGVDLKAVASDTVKSHRSWVTDVKAIPAALVAWILEEDPVERYDAMGAVAAGVAAVADARSRLSDLMKRFGEVVRYGPGNLFQRTASLESMIDSARSVQELIPRLLPWAKLLRNRSEVSRLHLTELVAKIEGISVQPEMLPKLLQAAVAYQHAKQVWRTNMHLEPFAGSEFNRLRSSFAEEDVAQLEKNRRIIAARLAGGGVGGNAARAALTTPEMQLLLDHEEGKRRKHLPIRKLVERAGPRMQELCPCWLMTPMAVAQFLTPGSVQFDLVIMDEASQLPPEDAWGAIARGQQLVVVGDPKQMPPSDFFAASSEEVDVDDEALPDGAALDSILDTAKNCMPQATLQWHYRSRHQSLIAPANRFSYGDRLILFPSPFDRHPELGVRHHFVSDGIAATGRVVNPKEAAAVVDRLVGIAKEQMVRPAHQRHSVGVVAMNTHQMDCIQDLLDARRRGESSVDRAIACLEENTEEPLLVMNLENVQGDQRDIILISYTYAPNAAGASLNNRFGPINFDGGERRFNVLITRAKWRMEVFASIRSEQIVISGKRPGVQHFHYFLKFAESGVLVELGGHTGRAPESPFEEHALAVLKSAGYDVEPQVGVAGYFVDMAVRHPKDPDRFAIGIECDGAMYHSSRAARDRDRLRESVLRDRGWELHRIWSTDWFTNHEAAKRELLDAVERACLT